MNANMKKSMMVVAVAVVAMVMAMSGGNAEAKKDTIAPGASCGHCAQSMRNGTIECKLVSCESGCQYVCTNVGPIVFDE